MTDERKPLPAAPITRSLDDGTTVSVPLVTGQAAINAARARAAAQPAPDYGRAYELNVKNLRSRYPKTTPRGRKS
jgi:hypothetical protein